MPVHNLTPVKIISQCTLITACSGFINWSYEPGDFESISEN